MISCVWKQRHKQQQSGQTELHKNEKLFCIKRHYNKVKKQPIEMNKIFANYLPVMKSIFEIFSELLKVNNKTNNSNQK